MTAPAESGSALTTAVAEGVITQAQADAIRAIDARGKAKDEPFTLVNNFGDLFLCLGLVIVYLSISRFTMMVGIEPMLVYLAFAALFWVLADIFVFKARRKFPAVISALLFVWLGFQAWMLAFPESFSIEALIAGRGTLAPLGIASVLFAAALIRFRLPILVLGLSVSAVLLVFTYAMRHVEPLAAFSVLALCGAALLAVGIYLDLRDRSRTGPQHEWALWLFVVGSPLLVHGIMLHQMKAFLPTAIGFTAAGASPEMLVDQMGGIVLTISALALLFTLLGLILDRRSLVASSLLYFTGVLSYAAWQSGAGLGVIFAAVPLAIGLLVIVLGLAWNPLRDLILRLIPIARWFRPPSKA